MLFSFDGRASAARGPAVLEDTKDARSFQVWTTDAGMFKLSREEVMSPLRQARLLRRMDRKGGLYVTVLHRELLQDGSRANQEESVLHILTPHEWGEHQRMWASSGKRVEKLKESSGKHFFEVRSSAGVTATLKVTYYGVRGVSEDSFEPRAYLFSNLLTDTIFTGNFLAIYGHIRRSEESACSQCGARGHGFQQCARCQAARYCSKECQKAAWKQGHKEACMAEG